MDYTILRAKKGIVLNSIGACEHDELETVTTEEKYNYFLFYISRYICMFYAGIDKVVRNDI